MNDQESLRSLAPQEVEMTQELGVSSLSPIEEFLSEFHDFPHSEQVRIFHALYDTHQYCLDLAREKGKVNPKIIAHRLSEISESYGVDNEILMRYIQAYGETTDFPIPTFLDDTSVHQRVPQEMKKQRGGRKSSLPILTDKQKEDIHMYHAKGYSRRRIVFVLKLSPTAVVTYMKEAGLPPQPKGRNRKKKS